MSQENFKNKIHRFFYGIENSSVPISYLIATFLFSIVIRNILENLVVDLESDLSLIDIVHFSSFYISAYICVTAIVLIFNGQNAQKIVRVCLTFSPVIAVPPIIDCLYKLILQKPVVYTYMTLDNINEVVGNYFSYFGGHAGISLGMRLEIGFIVFAAGVYSWYLCRRFWRSVLCALTVYSAIFWCFIALPIVLYLLQVGLGFQPDASEQLLSKIYVLTAIMLSVIILCRCRFDIAREIFVDIRFPRLLHYQGMVIFGLIIGMKYGGEWPGDLISFIELFSLQFGIVFAWIFSVITNNIVDIDIDRISNVDRPTVKNSISAKEYIGTSLVALLLSVLLCFVSGTIPGLLLFGFISVYFLYSVPPMRFKRVFVLSKMLIALNSLFLVLAGFSMSGKNLKSFPLSWILFVLIGFTLCINFIDIKDIAGDKKCGIMTLPVVAGEKLSKILISAFFVFTYLTFTIVAKMQNMALIATVLSFFVCAAILKKIYSDNIVFVSYLITSSTLIILFAYDV